MKTVVGQTEYLYSLMRTAQTRPPTLKFSPALCFLSPLNSKDLCCFEAKGMRKCCLPSYRGTVFPSRWQMAQCPTLSWLEWKMLPIACCNTFLQYWSQCLLSATGSYKPCVVMFLSQFTVKVRISVISLAQVRTKRVAVLPFVLPASVEELHQAFLREEGSWCQLSIVRWTWVALTTQNMFLLSNSIQKWMSVGEYKNRTHCITCFMMISVQHCLPASCQVLEGKDPVLASFSTVESGRCNVMRTYFLLCLLF